MKRTKSIVMLLTLVLISSASFSMDVPDSHWAKAHIDSVILNNIMTTDAGGNFEPDRLTTKIEALIVIYRSVKAGGLIDEYELESVVADYETRLVAMGLPRDFSNYGDDVYPAVAYALDGDIVTLEELKSFISNKQPTVLKKNEFAVYLAKTLNNYKNENLNKIIILQYQDVDKIDPVSRKYLMFLIEEGILSSKGDVSGNFNPDSNVNRTIMATMIDGFHTSIESLMTPDTSFVETEIKPVIESEKTITGTIKKVNDNDKTIIFQESTGKLTTIDIKAATISHLGIDMGYYALIPNTNADVTFKNGIATLVMLDLVYESIEGVVVSISENISEAINYSSMKLQLSNGNYVYKRVNEETLITINGISANPSNLKPDYRVDIQFDGYYAKRITAYTQHYEFNAMVEEIIGESRIRLRMEYGVTFEIDYKPGFSVGDIIKVTTLNGEVTGVENVGKAYTFSGKVVGINIKEQPELTVGLHDDVVKIHQLASGFAILDETGEETLDIYDLRLDQEVSVITGIGDVVRVNTGKRILVEETGNLFTVTQVFESSSILIATDKEGQTRTLVFALGSGLSVLDYNKGDVIYAEGKALTDQLFEASKITVADQ